MTNPLIIRCDIHGDIRLSKTCSKIISHHLFQRLRYIHQNGLLYLIYPGMTHSRFEHAIGTYHLSCLWLKELQETFKSDSEFLTKIFPLSGDTEVQKNGAKKILFEKTKAIYQDLPGDWARYVSAAALCHDLGHGPLSHTFEKCGLLSIDGYESFCTNLDIEEYLKDKKEIEHEDLSILFLDRIFKDQFQNMVLESLEREVTIVGCLINKDFKEYCINNSVYLSSEDKLRIKLFSPIISGLFDVDRLDYLVRDSKKAGVLYGVIDNIRVLKSVIPVLTSMGSDIQPALFVKSRSINMLDHILVSLYEMYAIVYHHPDNEVFQDKLIKIISRLKKSAALEPMSVDKVSKLSDHEFIEMINRKSGGLLMRVLKRQLDEKTIVFERQGTLGDQFGGKYNHIKVSREMIKDSIDIWLLLKSPQAKPELVSWEQLSLVKGTLSSQKFTSSVWWKNTQFMRQVSALGNKSGRLGNKNIRKKA